MISTSPSPAGWYPDPTGRGEFRWWTGTAWTYRFASGGHVYSEATGNLSGYPAPQASGPIATDGHTAPRGTRPAEGRPVGAVRLRSAPDVVEVRLSPGAAFKAGF